MKLACLQVAPSQADVAQTLAQLDAFAAQAKQAGCALLITPEMYLTGYNIGAERVAELAEPADGAFARNVAGIAQDHGIAILYGYPEADPEGGAPFNAVQLVDATGQRVGNYRKTHLFGAVDRAQFQAGASRSPVLIWNGWKVALAICYDVEFPELIRAYALDGAELVLAPTANMAPFDSVALRLVPARAEENGLFMAYANFCGSEGDFDYCGLSCVCGPDGRDIRRAGREAELIVADIDQGDIAKARAAVRYLGDRRPEIYDGTGTPSDDI